LKAVRRNVAESEVRVVLFAFAIERQCVVIGCTVMDCFVQHTFKCKVKAICLATGEIAGYRFCGKYGLRRRAEYKGPRESYLANRPIEAFMY
jgi:hypothetical protein